MAYLLNWLTIDYDVGRWWITLSRNNHVFHFSRVQPQVLATQPVIDGGQIRINVSHVVT